jgi:ClpP class serine protease
MQMNSAAYKGLTGEVLEMYAATANRTMYMEPDSLYSFRYNLSAMMEQMSQTGKPADELIKDFFFIMEDEEERPGFKIEDNVAIIPVTGPLTNKDPSSYLVRYGIVSSYPAIRQAMAAAQGHSEVDAIVTWYDSPGGIGIGLFNAMEEVAGYRGQKPMYGIVSPDAFSAAYGLISTMDEIFIDRDGRAGSIGTIVVHEDISERLKGLGVNVESFTYGRKKDLFASFKPLSDEAKKEYQEMVDQHGREFVEMTARYLGLSFDVVKNMEAGIYVGQSAVDAGLASKILSYEAALEEIKSRHSVKRSTGKGVNSMKDLQELKTKNPEAYEALMAEAKTAVAGEVKESLKSEVRSEVETQVRSELAASGGDSAGDVSKQIQEMRATIDNQTQVIQSQSEKIQSLEKSEAKRSFQAIKDAGDRIWDAALAKSDIPVGYYKKAKNGVLVKDFVDDSGAFDRDGFSKAVADEIADWENVGSDAIMGVGAGGGGEAGGRASDEAYDKEADELAGYVGQGGKTE